MALKGEQKPANYGTLNQEAAADAAQGAQLQSYLTSGTLPPGIASGLEGAHASAAATIRSQYAARGQSGSSAEAADSANLANTTVSQGATIATNLLNSGISESEFSSQLYQQLMATSIQQDNALSQSIANFSGALGGFGLKNLPTTPTTTGAAT